MKVTANVKKIRKQITLFLEKEQEDMQMAPNSIFLISLFRMKKMKWKLERMYWQ